MQKKRLTSAALSERAAYSYQHPGFRFAPPWAEVSYAFGVPPENAPIAELLFTLTNRSLPEKVEQMSRVF